MTTTTDTRHRDTVLGLYDAFGRGDLDSMLAVVADEVDWGLDPASPVVRAVPWLGHVGRRDDVAARYFAGIAADLEWETFEPEAVAQDGNAVVSVIREAYVVRRTGRRVACTAVHHFTFDPDGRIARYRPIVDTDAMIAAPSPTDVALQRGPVPRGQVGRRFVGPLQEREQHPVRVVGPAYRLVREHELPERLVVPSVGPDRPVAEAVGLRVGVRVEEALAVPAGPEAAAAHSWE